MKKLILFIFLAVAAIAVFAGCSQNNVYRLIKVNSFNGAVSVQRQEKMDAFEGLQLISEDYVEVGSDSLLELLADSDKHIVAEENTAFTLQSTGTETSGNITVNLLYGKSLYTIENKLNESSTFEVKTPNASLSVRGTIFSTSYDPKEKKTIVKVSEGVVHVTYNGGEKTLEKGDALSIKDNDGETIAEEIAPSTSEKYFGNQILYTNIQLNSRSEERDVERFSVSAYKDLLNLDLPENYTMGESMDCNGKIYKPGDYSFESVNGEIMKPFAIEIIDYLSAHKDELNKIVDEAITNYLDNFSGEIDDKSYTDLKLDPELFNWMPQPLIMESEYGNSEFKIETFEPEISFLLSEKSYDNLYKIEYTHSKTGKKYYLAASTMTIRCHGIGERIN